MKEKIPKVTKQEKKSTNISKNKNSQQVKQGTDSKQKQPGKPVKRKIQSSKPKLAKKIK